MVSAAEGDVGRRTHGRNTVGFALGEVRVLRITPLPTVITKPQEMPSAETGGRRAGRTPQPAAPARAQLPEVLTAEPTL